MALATCHNNFKYIFYCNGEGIVCLLSCASVTATSNRQPTLLADSSHKHNTLDCNMLKKLEECSTEFLRLSQSIYMVMGELKTPANLVDASLKKSGCSQSVSSKLELNLSDSLGGVKALGACTRTVEDSVTAVQAELILQLFFSLRAI